MREPGPDGAAALERLADEANGGAPVCAIAVAAFEARFVVDAPGSWWSLGDPNAADRVGLDEVPAELRPALPPEHHYRTMSDTWAERLEAACRLHDRQTGQPASGIRSLLEDLYGWTPAAGAPLGARHDEHDVKPGDITRHQRDLEFPMAVAFFISRLQRRARELRRRGDPGRELRSAMWQADQDAGRLTRWGASRVTDGSEARRRDLDDWIDAADDVDGSNTRPDDVPEETSDR